MTMDAMTILERLHQLGVTVSVREGRLRLKPGSRVTPELIAALRELKPQLLAELDPQRHWESEPWILREWRQISIRDWRRILRESIDQGDRKREEYARWMLTEILDDPEYEVKGRE